MSLTQLAPPYPIFTDKDGSPLDNGYLYFGEIDKNPETNPIQVYYDSAFTQPAAQPVRTINGYPSRNGSPAAVYTDQYFSITVRNKKNELVVYAPSGYGITPGTSASSTDQITYNEGSTGAIDRSLTSRLQDYVSVKDFGAVGDGVTDDTAAVAFAINYILSETNAQKLYVPAGYYKINGVLPNITKAITIQGDNERSTQFVFSGTTTPINIAGASTRATDVIFQNIGLNGHNMTGGYLVSIDWAQNIIFQNVIFNDPYNACYLRQCGNVLFTNCLMDKVRGTVGLHAYATNTARNGENDQIDIISLVNSVIQGNYVSGGSTPTMELMVLDGRVHTIQINGLRLLNALRGIVTKNTPGLASNFVPRFITGDALEMENHYAECGDFQACMDFWIDNIFAAGSNTADGIKLSSSVANWQTNKGSINSNYLHGLNTNGATEVCVSDVTVYNNSLVGASVKSGIYVNGSGRVNVRGGLAGKASWLPSYTEPQKYGIELDASYNGIIFADGVDLRGNATGSLYDNNGSASGSCVKSCPGYNPNGSSLQSVGASPYIYTAGLTQESVQIYGGAGVTSEIDGVFVANVSPCSFTLQPRQSVVVTYVSIPTMAINRS